MSNKTAIIFDLDDTLMQERDFLESAYREIAGTLIPEHAEEAYTLLLRSYDEGGDPFGTLINHYHLPFEKQDLLNLYRHHQPRLCLSPDAQDLLDELKARNIPMGIISDGRSCTQRAKIQALGLDAYIPRSAIIISEEFGSAKPDSRNYSYFHHYYPDHRYIYVGDNPAKDFIAPRKLGWLTACLQNNGRNIHPQRTDLPADYMPDITLQHLTDLTSHILSRH